MMNIQKLFAPGRREFLKRTLKTAGAVGLAAAARDLLGSPVLAADAKNEMLQSTTRPVKTGQFVFPRLRFSVTDETHDLWNIGPIGDAILRHNLSQLTNINVSQEPRVVTLGDFDDMVRNPFVFMTSEGHFELNEHEQKNLREYLERGGFIHADDCVYKGKEDRFFRAYVNQINKLFPDNPMRKIPYDHEIFHIYFDFKNGAPHCQGVPNGAYGLFEPGTGRIMTVCTPGDLHCGWMSRFFAKEKDEAAIQMGINIIIYFLTH